MVRSGQVRRGRLEERKEADKTSALFVQLVHFQEGLHPGVKVGLQFSLTSSLMELVPSGRATVAPRKGCFL